MFSMFEWKWINFQNLILSLKECLHTENYLRHFYIFTLISNNFDNILQYNRDPVAYWDVCQKTVFSFWQSQSDI